MHWCLLIDEYRFIVYDGPADDYATLLSAVKYSISERDPSAESPSLSKILRLPDPIVQYADRSFPREPLH
jgi:hypothetical protein